MNSLHLQRAFTTLLAAGVLAQPLAAGAQAAGDMTPPAQALPSLGDAGDMTPLLERKLGDAIARELLRDADYLDDAILGEYVDGIWHALLAGARARGELPADLDEGFAWRVMLGRDATINAFALPGGYLGLHTALIGVVRTRDELASVLAHELSHITQRHIARMLGRQSRQTPLIVAAILAGLVAGASNPQAGTALVMGGQAVGIQQQLNYSRDMEREADRIGLAIATQAGFRPEGFAAMFETLQNAQRLMDNGDWPYLRSHPLTTQRIADMRQREKINAPAVALPPDLQALLMAARARVLSRPGVDTLHAWANAPDSANFATLALPQRAAVLYAGALAQAQLRDLPKAERSAAALAGLVASDASAARQARLLQAELAILAGAPQRALQWLPAAASGGRGKAAAARDPQGSQQGRAELLLRAMAQTATGHARDAATALQVWISDHPLDAAAWQQLAAACNAQGQTLRALRAEGEAQVAQMDLQGAIDRFRAAQDHARQHPGNRADLIEASIIDARLRTVQEALRQQKQDEAQLP
ncbi:MAG: M48 family metalloprotease [Burkholderiaceae bacterium]|jgi:predicted Zn-dependent protease|nr:M48 family metalloprotease [Burkholderiaceae bacterium]